MWYVDQALRSQRGGPMVDAYGSVSRLRDLARRLASRDLEVHRELW